MGYTSREDRMPPGDEALRKAKRSKLTLEQKIAAAGVRHEKDLAEGDGSKTQQSGAYLNILVNQAEWKKETDVAESGAAIRKNRELLQK